jgi:hypothetical protein
MDNMYAMSGAIVETHPTDRPCLIEQELERERQILRGNLQNHIAQQVAARLAPLKRLELAVRGARDVWQMAKRKIGH